MSAPARTSKPTSPTESGRASTDSRSTINDWVGEQTEDLVPELLPEGFIDGQTVLVLTDALYFEAPWVVPFDEYRREGEFTRLDGSTVRAPLIRQVRVADRHGRGDGFAAAEVPYAGDEFSMLVIVPHEGRFADVRARLSGELLRSIDATFGTGPYELLLPPWEGDTPLDLKTWLTDIGAAPGSYPGSSADAELGAAVHAADIAVDQWGTVAAAATGLGADESSLPEPEQTIAAGPRAGGRTACSTASTRNYARSSCFASSIAATPTDRCNGGEPGLASPLGHAAITTGLHVRVVH